MIRESSAPRARRRLRAWVLAALAVLPITAALAATQYLYDDLGRLVLAASSDGSATVYAHDENGNVVSISQWAASGPVIAGFSPMYGHAGTTVTIMGAGFSATPANNTVTIGGVPASVSAATPTTLVSAIPQGADTGPITVTVDGVTATSAQNITVYKPLIASFSPTLVAPGGSVTVTGANLNLVSGGTSLTVAATSVTVTSLSNNQAVFTAPNNNTGGPITVTTPYGQATSAMNLVIVPNAVGVANVVDHDAVEPNGSSQSLAINQQNKVALLSFQATANSFYSVQVDALTLTPAGGSIGWTLYGPTGATITWGNVSSTSPTIHLPKTTAAGRYLVAFGSGSKTSVQITARIELAPVLAANDTTLPFSTPAVYQSRRFTFTANVGDDLGLAFTNLVLTPSSPNYVRLWLTTPAGNSLNGGTWCYTTSVPGCSFNLFDLPETGTYQFSVEAMGSSTMSFDVTLSAHATGTLTAGTPSPVTLAAPGKMAALTFSATAGQVVALQLGSATTTPAGKPVAMRVYNPSGTAVSSVSTTTQTTLNLTNLVAGTYTVVVIPNDAATGSATVTLANGVAASLPANGTTQSFATTLPQQHAYFTFSATAGDDLGLALTNLVLTPSSPNYVRVWMTTPAGNQLPANSSYCYATVVPGCSYNLLNLPETGVYRFSIESMGQQTMSFGVTLSTATTGTLTQGTPSPVTLAVPGQMALLTFTATAGQTAALQLSSVSTTPAGKPVAMWVYNPSGTQVASASTTTQTTLNLTNLVAGTYSVLVYAYDAATGSATVKLAGGVTASLPANGTTQTFATTLPQQHAYFTFSATAGDDLGLALTNLVVTPSSPNYVRVWMTTPAGNQLPANSSYCYATVVPGCSYNLLNLPETGVYRFSIESMGQQTMSFDVTLSAAATGALIAGTPYPATLALPGQMALLTFTATAGQAAALQLSSVSTTPAGKPVAMWVYNPSGTQVASASTTTQTTLNLTNLVAGTYSVLVSANDAATGSATVTLANGVAAPLPANGTTQSFTTTVPQQHAYFTFSATAGDDLGLALTNLAVTPGSPNYVRIWMSTPAGNQLPANSSYCYATVVPGCSYNLMNLPETGVYRFSIESMGQQTMSFDVTLSPAIATALSPSAPTEVDLDAPGEFAMLPFSITSGEPLAIKVASGGTTPSGKTVQLAVYNPSGAIVRQATLGSGANLNLANLSSGTYSLLISPADGSLLEAIAEVSHTFSVWNDSTVPGTPATSDPNAVELGVKFKVDYDGYITGIRFYKGTSNGGTHLGNLWSVGGTLLASATFANETATGWQQVDFATPVAVTANTVYVASYHAPQGHFAYTASALWYGGIDNGPVHLLQNGVSGANGVYAYGAQSAFPTSNGGGGYYWVDVVYEFVDASPPNVVISAPKSGTGVASTTANITATFDEAMDPASLSAASFELRAAGGGAAISAAITYDSGINTAILDPDAALASTTSYTATVKGGPSGVRDSSGNALSADHVWTFTTTIGPAHTVWPDTQVPTNPASTNTAAYELGVKFKVDTDGYIAGIRFYKGVGNGGTHVGNLWSASGSLLASATFTNETATGWQQVEFATPVAVTANTVYVASYLCPQGRFAYTESFLANNGVDAGPIHLLKNGVSGANGLYAAGSTSAFPTNSYLSSYYWVDIVFVQNP